MSTALAFVPASRLRRAPAPERKPDPNPDIGRPRTRVDCQDGPRPCPYVACRHHLALDVTKAGAIKIRSGPSRGSTLRQGQTWGVDDWLERAAEMALEMPETCSLDIADRGETTLDEIASFTNMTRQRVQQEEQLALRRLRLAKFNGVGDLSQDGDAES